MTRPQRIRSSTVAIARRVGERRGGWRRAAGPAGLALTAALLLAGCGGLFTAQVDDGPPLPTPIASLTPAIAGTAAALDAALAAQRLALDPPAGPYRPPEPASFTTLPRAIFQARIGDPLHGWVVCYQLPDAAAADVAARELAAWLGSGFGQTNFPAGSQLHVAVDGSVVVMTWWARESAADPELAETAYDAVASVGVAVPVLK
jgi:hypothetical protein